MSFDPISQIKARTREEWSQALYDRVTNVRIWLQEHGEAGCFIGFLVGMLFATAFQLVLGILAFGALVCLTIYLLAENEALAADRFPAPKPFSSSENATESVKPTGSVDDL